MQKNVASKALAIRELPRWIAPGSIEEAKVALIGLGSNLQQGAYATGKYLMWVKSRLAHGQFEVWVERNIKLYAPRTARQFMVFAELCDEKGRLLDRVYSEKLKTAETADLHHKPQPDLPDGKFEVIYADPPWAYNNSGFEESAAMHYPTMTNEEIFELAEKLEPRIAEEAVLFLWVTAPFLDIGIQTCDAWSFNYKQNLIWIKNKGPSVGWFVQSRHEHLLIATRGEGMHPKIRPMSWFKAKVGRHSQKPEIVYKMIEEMYPGHKYLELFARNKRSGWVSWGNQINEGTENN